MSLVAKLVVVATLATWSVVSAEPAATALDGKRSTAGLPKQLQGMTFVYDGDLEPADYVRKNPCVTGSWECQAETDTHWIGNVYYPSDNADPNAPFYMADGIKVAKSKELKVNLTAWKGWILLRKPTAAIKLLDKDKQAFVLVGYDPKGNYMTGGTLDLHKLLPYKPPNKP